MVFHVDEDRITPHNHDNIATVYEDKGGRLWVTHEELLACEYRGLTDFDVVYLNGKFYELQAHIRGPNAWWIEEVEEAEAPEQAPETLEGESS